MAAAADDDLDREGNVVLDRGACLALLALGGLGRIGVSVGALPVILPVHFDFEDGEVLFWTPAASTLATATHQAVVAFETDGLDDARRHWSVALTGRSRHLAGPPSPRQVQVAVRPELISGRREQQGASQVRGIRHT